MLAYFSKTFNSLVTVVIFDELAINFHQLLCRIYHLKNWHSYINSLTFLTGRNLLMLHSQVIFVNILCTKIFMPSTILAIHFILHLLQKLVAQNYLFGDVHKKPSLIFLILAHCFHQRGRPEGALRTLFIVPWLGKLVCTYVCGRLSSSIS